MPFAYINKHKSYITQMNSESRRVAQLERLNAYRLIMATKPNPINYNMQTDDGRCAFNRAIDEFYKLHGLYAGTITCDIYAGQTRRKVCDFSYTICIPTDGDNECVKVKPIVPRDGKYDSQGNYIGPFQRDWKDIPFIKEGYKYCGNNKSK